MLRAQMFDGVENYRKNERLINYLNRKELKANKAQKGESL